MPRMEGAADHPAFAPFGVWQGDAAPGTTRNFLGVVTRTEFFVGHPSFDRAAGSGLPPLGEAFLQWLSLLESVVAADGRFTMLELGAGWGKGIVNGAVAARLRGLEARVIGVEAEPAHACFTRTHLADNGIGPDVATVVEAAVAARAGRVCFHAGDATAWYGQAIAAGDTAVSGRTGTTVVDVPAVTLSSLLDGVGRVDLIDLDVQGVEADVLEEAEPRLAAQVRRVHVGTHGPRQEERLRALFGRLGWECLHDYACGSRNSTPYGEIAFNDGVQAWRNPAL